MTETTKPTVSKIFLDKNNKPTEDMQQAVRIELVEFDKDGNVVRRTYMERQPK